MGDIILYFKKEPPQNPILIIKAPTLLEADSGLILQFHEEASARNGVGSTVYLKHSPLYGYHGEPKVNFFHNIRIIQALNLLGSITLYKTYRGYTTYLLYY